MLLFTIVTNELVVGLQGGLSMMRFFRPPAAVAAIGDFEISRQARPKFEISISTITQSGDFKVTATGGKNTSLTVLPVANLGSFLRFICLEEIDFFCVEHTVKFSFSEKATKNSGIFLMVLTIT